MNKNVNPENQQTAPEAQAVSNPPTWNVGDVANGHVLAPGGRWVPFRYLAPGAASQWMPGDVVNGSVFTGSEWKPVNGAAPLAQSVPGVTLSHHAAPQKPKRTGLKVALWVVGIIVGLGVLQGISSIIQEQQDAQEAGGTSGGVEVPAGSRAVSADYVVGIDADRSVRIVLTGGYTVDSSVEQAGAGLADVATTFVGEVTYTNLSPDRAIDVGADHTVEAFIAQGTCDQMGPSAPAVRTAYCTKDIVNLEIPSLDPGQSVTRPLTGRTRQTLHHVGEVPEVNVGAIKTGIESAVLVATKRMWLTGSWDRWNSTCGKGQAAGGGDLNWVTFWSESKKVTTCSTER